MSSHCYYLLAFALLSARAEVQKYVSDYKEVKDWDYWDKEHLDMCLHASATRSAHPSRMFCYRHRLHIEFVDVELYSERPVVMHIHDFVGKSVMDEVKNSVHRSDSVWMEQDDPAMTPIFNRMNRLLRLNPQIAEEFMILKYDVRDNVRTHFDYLSPIGPHPGERRLEALGNRIATALLVVQPALKGGGTLFPKLKTVIQYETGDLLLWFNCDSNDVREDDAMHAACPVENGEKIVLSRWFRSNFQDGLWCSTRHPGYELADVLKRGEKWENDYLSYDVNL